MRIDAGASSDVGRLRTGNEDSFLVDDRLELYAVADGMGGHNAGEIASATALEALRAAVASGKALDTAIVLANSAIFDKAATDSALSGMGTTLTAVTILGESTLLVGHVGDSRAYRIRDGTLEQITEDHSLVEELVREGRLSPEEAEVHPRRSVITRALGIDPDVDVDLFTLDAQTGDRLLVCSDGLTTMVRDDDVLRIAELDTDPRVAADRLVDAANEAGGEDNITVLIIDVLEAPPAAPPDPEALSATTVSRTPLPVAAPDVPDDEPKRRRPRLRSFGGFLLYVVPVLVIVGLGIGAINWYARNTYYVDFKGDRVVVFQGVPGGILGWEPTVKTTTDLRRSQLTPDAIDQIDRSGKGSLERAEQFVGNLERGGREHNDYNVSDHNVSDHNASDHKASDHSASDHTDAADNHHDGRPVTDLATMGRTRRNSELGLGFLAVVVTIGGYILLALANGPSLPPDLGVLLAGVVGLYVVAHLAVRRLAPRAIGTLLPLAALLNGIGFVTIARIDQGLISRGDESHLARIQSVWSAVGVGAFVLILLLVRNTRTLERYTYTFAFVALALLLVPLIPSLGTTVNGARIWARLGPLHFQPGEPAKVLWVAFFAGYLTQKRELLSEGSRSIGRLRLPAARHLGPLIATWGVSILVLVFERDLGSSLLFFAVFASMLYMATERSVYIIGSLALFTAGAFAGYHLFSHVRDRVQGWLNPWPYRLGPKGFQIIQSWYAFAAGGISGKGIGLGIPDRIPYASTDFIFAAIGEELGLVGTVGVVICFMLIVGSGFRIAIESTRPFSKLFVAGLTTILGLQTFIIIGGVTRMIPLTGITLPFVSYGGSSLVANFVILALLLRMSDENANDAAAR